MATSSTSKALQLPGVTFKAVLARNAD